MLLKRNFSGHRKDETVDDLEEAGRQLRLNVELWAQAAPTFPVAHRSRLRQRINSYRGVFIADTTIGNAQFRGVDFDFAQLQNTRFDRTFLGAASLVSANLSGATLFDCYVDGANFLASDLTGVTWRNVQMQDASMVATKWDSGSLLENTNWWRACFFNFDSSEQNSSVWPMHRVSRWFRQEGVIPPYIPVITSQALDVIFAPVISYITNIENLRSQ